MLFYFTPDKLGFPKWETKEALSWMMENEGKKCWAEVGRETEVRTDTQNRALHKYFDLLAKELNAAGYTVQLVLKEKVDLSWDGNKIKELIWRPAQEAITGKKSTTKLDKVSEITEVWEHLNLHLSEKFGIHVAFPSEQTNLAAQMQ
jgi:hypothetical protein